MQTLKPKGTLGGLSPGARVICQNQGIVNLHFNGKWRNCPFNCNDNFTFIVAL